MIIFDRPRTRPDASGHSSHMRSSLYGHLGSKELRACARRMRLDTREIRHPGDPVKEFYIIPASKIDAALKQGASQLADHEIENFLVAKHSVMLGNIAKNAILADRPAIPAMTPDVTIPHGQHKPRKPAFDRFRDRMCDEAA